MVDVHGQIAMFTIIFVDNLRIHNDNNKLLCNHFQFDYRKQNYSYSFIRLFVFVY